LPRSARQTRKHPAKDDDLPIRLQRMAIFFHRRWSAPILAELLRGDTVQGGAKFITLANRLRLSRESLKATLDHLILHDYVMRNPGYGHPLRPEYILAEAGHDIAPACRDLMRILTQSELERAALRKWSMPALLAIGRGVRRFGALKIALSGITARALTLALKDLASARLVRRRVIDRYPPVTAYSLTRAARSLLVVLERF
jgi:DNA-binding HxlR family transcriptional regulator